MNAKRVIPTLTVAAACTVGAVPIATARAADVQQASSGNWSGYVVGSSAESRSFKSVTGSWVQPTAKCSADAGATYSAFWVGLGGASGSEALEQDGTEVNCSAAGTASYYAWYELVPKAPVKTDLAVHPGDHMTATTAVNGHSVTETIVNHTTGQSFSKTLTMSDPDTSSAEWIAEAPSQCEGSVDNCSTLSLSDFGTVKFTAASATDSSGHTGSISDSAWSADALTLTPDAVSSGYGGGSGIGYAGQGETTASASAGASPSSLRSSGSAFSVSYQKASAASSAAGGSGYGTGSGDGYGGTGSGYGYGGYGGSGAGGYGGEGYGGSAYGYGEGGYGYGSDTGEGYGSSADGGYIVVYTY